MDQVMEIGQREAEETMRALARVEGIFAGAFPARSCLKVLQASNFAQPHLS